jgi:phage gp36-like protein
MAYATVTDMISAFSEQEILELSNIDYPDNTTINEGVVVRAVADASAQIDGYLATRYSTPIIDPVPPIVRNYTCDVARYLLDKDKPREEVTRRRDLVFYFLKDLAGGRANLPGLNTADSTSASDMPLFYTGGRVWTSESLKDY